MLSVTNLKNDCKLLIKRSEKFNENDLARQQFLASTLRVVSYMATIGCGVLAVVSLATLCIPGVLAFSLGAVMFHDMYYIAKNWDEKELQKTSKRTLHTGQIILNVYWAECNNKNPDTAVRLSRSRNLTESTFIAKHIVALASSIIES